MWRLIFFKSVHFWSPCLISISFQQIFNEHILYRGGMYIQVLYLYICDNFSRLHTGFHMHILAIAKHWKWVFVYIWILKWRIIPKMFQNSNGIKHTKQLISLAPFNFWQTTQLTKTCSTPKIHSNIFESETSNHQHFANISFFPSRRRDLTCSTRMVYDAELCEHVRLEVAVLRQVGRCLNFFWRC